MMAIGVVFPILTFVCTYETHFAFERTITLLNCTFAGTFAHRGDLDNHSHNVHSIEGLRIWFMASYDTRDREHWTTTDRPATEQVVLDPLDADGLTIESDRHPDLPYYLELNGAFSIRHASTDYWDDDEATARRSASSKWPRHGAIRQNRLSGATAFERRRVPPRRTRHSQTLRHRIT
jgi:hypothetical protein